MGNGILSRSGSGDGAKIGDIRLSTRDSIGAKWALCNGDAVDAGTPIGEYCSFDPTDTSNWYSLSSTVTAPQIILYDPLDNIYWGIYLSTTTLSSSKTISIYKYDRDMRGETVSAVYSTTLAANYTIYDACFVYDADTGAKKIAFAYYAAGTQYIAFYDIISGNCGFSNSSYRIAIETGGMYSFNTTYSFDTSSSVNGARNLILMSAGKYVVLFDTQGCQLVSFDSNSPSSQTAASTFCPPETLSGIASYASGPYHTAVMILEGTESNNYIYIIDNSTGEVIDSNDYAETSNAGNFAGVHVSCIYENGTQYFIWFSHGDSSTVYRGYMSVSESGTCTFTQASSVTGSTIFGYNAAYNGSYYEFKIGDSYYALALNTYSSGCRMCQLAGKAGTVSSKSTIDLGGIYSADRNIFGYKSGPIWYMLSNAYNGDIYFTTPCLPTLQEGSYNGFIKVEN